jgi:hypothetical protein
MFNTSALFLQYRYFVGRIGLTPISTDDQLYLEPHATPPLWILLTMELTLSSVRGYPRFLMHSLPRLSEGGWRDQN